MTRTSLALISICATLSCKSAEGANVCTQPWPDVCDGSQASAYCTRYAPPLAQPIDWLGVRANLINVIFGRSNGSLPTENALPDAIIPVSGNTSSGCWCSTLGNCDANSCSWASNMTKLVFSISAQVNASFNLVLNSTVFWTLNTSGVASVLYGGPDDPYFPPYPEAPLRRSDTLVIHHQGHNSPCNVSGGDPDFDSTVDWLNQLGYDVFNLHMPLYQVNQVQGVPCDHELFAKWEAEGVSVFRFFLEPVVRAINYATKELGYKQIVMMGLSGGGWTTTLLGALDHRIALSMPVAGSVPCDFWHTSWDFEQYCNNVREWSARCAWCVGGHCSFLFFRALLSASASYCVLQSWAMVANYTSLCV
jgi:hypothetical protein